MWTVPGCDVQLSIAAHDDRITGIAWHPHADDTDAVAFATASADRTARLWNSKGLLAFSCLTDQYI